MTDGWSRPDPGTPDGSIAIEVPLTGAPETPAPVHGDEPPPNGRHRGIIAATIVAVALVGIVIAIQVGGGDEDAVAPEETEVDALASDLTTPPTLTPLDTLPSPDDPALVREPFEEGPQSTSSQDRALFDGVVRPSYPAVTDVGLPELVNYDIAAAVARLDDDVPRRSETHLELGTAGFLLDVTIERDPDRDRFRIRVETQTETQDAIVDVATGITYVRSNREFVADIPNEEIIDGSTASDIGEYFDRLLLGPVRPDSFNAAATRGRGVVTIDDVRVARQFIANVRGSAIPEWQAYAFGPVFEFPVEDRPQLLEYAVYVDEGGDIVQVDGVSQLGNVPQLIEHKLVRPSEPIVIDLPPDVAGPAGAAPSTEPTSASTSPSTSTTQPAAGG